MNVPTLIIVFNREDPARKLLELLQDIKRKNFTLPVTGRVRKGQAKKTKSIASGNWFRN